VNPVEETENTLSTTPHLQYYQHVMKAVEILERMTANDMMHAGAVILQDVMGINDPGVQWKDSHADLASSIYQELFQDDGELRPFYYAYLDKVCKHSPMRGNPKMLAASACQYGYCCLFGNEILE
jgi:hypothetical protein